MSNTSITTTITNCNVFLMDRISGNSFLIQERTIKFYEYCIQKLFLLIKEMNIKDILIGVRNSNDQSVLSDSA
jgi:hypothetical protein